jgi:hypothetical protein
MQYGLRQPLAGRGDPMLSKRPRWGHNVNPRPISRGSDRRGAAAAQAIAAPGRVPSAGGLRPVMQRDLERHAGIETENGPACLGDRLLGGMHCELPQLVSADACR